jgi:hypothetical protein
MQSSLSEVYALLYTCKNSQIRMEVESVLVKNKLNIKTLTALKTKLLKHQ